MYNCSPSGVTPAHHARRLRAPCPCCHFGNTTFPAAFSTLLQTCNYLRTTRTGFYRLLTHLTPTTDYSFAPLRLRARRLSIPVACRPAGATTPTYRLFWFSCQPATYSGYDTKRTVRVVLPYFAACARYPCPLLLQRPSLCMVLVARWVSLPWYLRLRGSVCFLRLRLQHPNA